MTTASECDYLYGFDHDPDVRRRRKISLKQLAARSGTRYFHVSKLRRRHGLVKAGKSKRLNAAVAVKFERLKRKWKNDSQFLSTVQEITTLPSYLEIIGLGMEAIPLILNEMIREPDHWFWALRYITGADPVPPEHYGQFDLVTKDWITWGRENGYY